MKSATDFLENELFRIAASDIGSTNQGDVSNPRKSENVLRQECLDIGILS